MVPRHALLPSVGRSLRRGTREGAAGLVGETGGDARDAGGADETGHREALRRSRGAPFEARVRPIPRRKSALTTRTRVGGSSDVGASARTCRSRR